jgi:hypothetical protein
MNFQSICFKTTQIISFQEVNSKPLQRILDYFNNDPWTNELTTFLSQLDFVRVSNERSIVKCSNM